MIIKNMKGKGASQPANECNPLQEIDTLELCSGKCLIKGVTN